MVYGETRVKGCPFECKSTGHISDIDWGIWMSFARGNIFGQRRLPLIIERGEPLCVTCCNIYVVLYRRGPKSSEGQITIQLSVLREPVSLRVLQFACTTGEKIMAALSSVRSLITNSNWILNVQGEPLNVDGNVAMNLRSIPFRLLFNCW